MAFSSITIQQHFLEEQQKYPRASGEFSFLLSGITLATKKIQAANPSWGSASRLD